MEVKINREIRNYTESIFFGLSLRQFFFSVLACISAIIIYFSLKSILGLEITSWICMLGAVPFVSMGFIKYNGMNTEEFFSSWVKSQMLSARKLRFEANNIYYELMKDFLKEKEKEELKKW